MKLDDENIVSFAKKLKAPIRVGKVSVLCATYLPTLPIHCDTREWIRLLLLARLEQFIVSPENTDPRDKYRTSDRACHNVFVWYSPFQISK